MDRDVPSFKSKVDPDWAIEDRTNAEPAAKDLVKERDLGAAKLVEHHHATASAAIRSSSVSPFWQFILITVASIFALGLFAFIGLVLYEWLRADPPPEADGSANGDPGITSSRSSCS